MKKKILITLMVVVLSLAIALTAFACKPKQPDNPNNGNDTGNDDPTPKTVSFTKVVNAIIDGAEQTLHNAASVEDAAYCAFTGYFELVTGSGDDATATKFELNVEGNFDEDTLANNKGYLEVRDTVEDETILAIYVDQSTVYIGEAFTATDINWVKLGQVDSTNFIAGYFAQLPAMVNDMLGDMADATPLSDPEDEEGMLSSIMGMLPMVGTMLFSHSYPEGFSEDDTDGNYALSIKVEDLGDVLQQEAVAGLIGGALTDYRGPINMVLPTLLGLEMLENGTIAPVGNVTPEVDLEFTITDGALSKIGVAYAKADDTETEDKDEAISVKFGLKNVVVDNAAKTTAITPTDMPSADTIGDGAIKLSMVLGAGQKDGIIQPITLDAYLVPNISVGYTEEDGFSFDLNGLMGYGFATFGEDQAELGMVYDAANGLAFDLAGLYEILGETPAGETVYYNSTLTIADEPAQGPMNSEGEAEEYTNIIDILFEAISGEVDILGLVTEQANNVLSIVTGLVGVVDDAIADDDIEGFAVLDVLALLDGLQDFEVGGEAFLESEILKEALGEYPSYYLDPEVIIQTIADAADMTVEEVEDIVCEFTGIELGAEESLADYIETNGLTIEMQGFLGETATNGAGFQFEILAGDDSIFTFGMTAQLVTDDDVTAAIAGLAIADFNFDAPGTAIDLDDDANWDAFLDELQRLGDVYLYGNELA
ncbi:MAG: hypothetical protein PHI19_06520 [Clostridia bacterium]|nr:hypothetical protein [Clostridia bacterium]